MLFDRKRPHGFRELRVAPAEAAAAAIAAREDARSRWSRFGALEAYAVHLAHDRERVVTVEAWRQGERHADGAPLYSWAATGGVEPTPVDDAASGEIVIDLFRIWRPLVRPMSAFNIRNGEAFNREPGCISTTVLRGLGHGAIATYARWRTVDDFLAAFEKIIGEAADDTEAVNRIAARKTFGVMKADYHAYELIAFEARR